MRERRKRDVNETQEVQERRGTLGHGSGEDTQKRLITSVSRLAILQTNAEVPIT